MNGLIYTPFGGLGLKKLSPKAGFFPDEVYPNLNELFLLTTEWKFLMPRLFLGVSISI